LRRFGTALFDKRRSDTAMLLWRFVMKLRVLYAEIRKTKDIDHKFDQCNECQSRAYRLAIEKLKYEMIYQELDLQIVDCCIP
jgi:hypothetical protein